MAANKKVTAETKISTPIDKASELMERYGVSVIYENSRGEFFLTKDLACNSESGKSDLVTTHKKQ